MKVETVTARLKEIQEVADDCEVAHMEQDKLYLDVLRAIANGAENAAELAAEAVKVDDMHFSRWFA